MGRKSRGYKQRKGLLEHVTHFECLRLAFETNAGYLQRVKDSTFLKVSRINNSPHWGCFTLLCGTRVQLQLALLCIRVRVKEVTVVVLDGPWFHPCQPLQRLLETILKISKCLSSSLCLKRNLLLERLDCQWIMVTFGQFCCNSEMGLGHM